ncbi:hypothetical protein ACOME3_001679 [Neoechinorhynchus agilis]
MWWVIVILIASILHSDINSLTSTNKSLFYVLVKVLKSENSSKAREISSLLDVDLLGNVYHSAGSYYLFSSTNIVKFSSLLNGEIESVEWAQVQDSKTRVKRNVGSFNDAQWPNMWYLNEDNHPDTARMNVYEAWKMGYTGRGVRVCIIDDGLEWTHLDLIKNYDPEASYDLNEMDSDPRPRPTPENQHGTRCAGVVAAQANNSFCCVGVAYNARIGGIRLLDGIVTDAHEAMAFSFGLNESKVDVFSGSWGPADNGAAVDGPNIGALKALELGVTQGRKGKGVIYVFATGNGGHFRDHCSCDGYVSSPYTIAVGSISERGHFPLYAERCPAILTTTFSSGNDFLDDRSIITTDLGSACTEHHTGTSVSAPMFSGIVALGLEANPSLCWRQVQYLAILSSRPLPNMMNPLSDDKTWWRNGAGLLVSDSFGYGMIDAGLLVKYAEKWKDWVLPNRRTCIVRPSEQYDEHNNLIIEPRSTVTLSICTTACAKSRAEITSLEHVEVVLSIKPMRKRPAERGTLQLFLKSPAGEATPLLLRRLNDRDTERGFNQWSFTSVLNWFEDPSGCWALVMENHSDEGAFELIHLKLLLHGVDFLAP